MSVIPGIGTALNKGEKEIVLFTNSKMSAFAGLFSTLSSKNASAMSFAPETPTIPPDCLPKRFWLLLTFKVLQQGLTKYPLFGPILTVLGTIFSPT